MSRPSSFWEADRGTYPAISLPERPADGFLRRQLVLTWVSGLVASATMALVGLALFLLPAAGKAWVIGTAVVGSIVIAAVLFVLLRHVITLAQFALRKEPT